MPAAAVAATALLLLAHVVAQPWYLDNASQASNLTSAPGGLMPERTPQFILLTVDDGLNPGTLIRSVTDGRTHLDGCPVPATMFVSMVRNTTKCSTVLELYRQGFEIAAHTLTHKRMVGVEREIAEGRRQLVECGVPEADIVGVRAPFLWVDPALRQVVHELGLLYDSSIMESMNGSVSNGFGDRLWPFDMGGGIPINCTSDDKYTQICSEEERWPGLWEVPVWQQNELDGPYPMDPGFSYECMCHISNHSALDILKANFDAAYSGNRAPFNVYVHPFWLKNKPDGFDPSLQQLQQFVEYALAKPDVWFITMRQLIAWMQNPVPVDELTPEVLGCGNIGGAGPAQPLLAT